MVQGVTVGERCGWVRVFCDQDSGTLVYLTHSTGVRDICRDLVLSEHFTVWIQHGGGEGRRLNPGDTPLSLQDDCLFRLGYKDSSRRARLGIDPDLRHIIRFYVGPSSSEPVDHSGPVYVLKGLVLPQWRRRTVAIIGPKIFIHPGPGSAADMEVLDLAGAEIEVSKTSRCGRRVLRLSATRQVFLGFDTSWERELWLSWLLQASETETSAHRLDLSGTGLEKIPEAVVKSWPAVEELNLSRNRLHGDLHSLERLPRLRKLNLAANEWTIVPAGITQLLGLTSLDLSNNSIHSLPQDISQLSRLEELRVDRNLLTCLPGSVGAFKRLKTLSAAHNNISHLPAFIHQQADDEESQNADIKNGRELRTINLRANLLKGNITLGKYGNLSQLDVSENNIESLDLSALDKLENVQCSRNCLLELSLNGSSLVSLIAGNNKLQKLNVEPRPSQLKHLDISYNTLNSLPEWIAGCQQLQTLFASHNNLTSLPDYLFCSELSSLQTLQLSFNKLTSLPTVICHIPLQQLFLQSNCISTLPEHFFLATSRLKVLNMSNNKLRELPSRIEDGHQLEKLFLTANLLSDIQILDRLTNLHALHLAYNCLTSLPESCISSWLELEELIISGNQITELPANIAQLPHLRVLRTHSNLLQICPSLGNIAALRVLDLANNHLDRVDLATLVPKRLQFLDISGNLRLHVDAKQFQVYRTKRAMSLVDVSGQNRSSLPCSPPHQEAASSELDSPWTLGFSETPGHRDRLCISQLRLPGFCNTEALLGMFDAGNNSELPQLLVKTIPRILLEERTVKETANDYMKYTMLSAHRELKEMGQRFGVCAMLCHIARYKTSSPGRYVLRIASVGEAKAVLSRSTGSLTLAHAPSQQTVRSQLGNSVMFPMVVPDPHVTEVVLSEEDDFLIIANKRLWEVLSVQEAIEIVSSIEDSVLSAKKLQDLAQSYGCEDNLSIMVLKFQTFNPENDPLIKELRSTIKRNSLQVESPCCCDNTHAMIQDGDRSSPSGQSDETSSGRPSNLNDHVINTHSNYDKSGLANSRNYQSVLMHENGTRKMSAVKHKAHDFYSNGNLADGEETSSDRSTSHLSEEQYRCWEYMLEQNTQLLFDKELDTLSRGFVRRSVPSRPGLWPRTKSSPHLTADQQPPFSRHFGSARSFHPVSNTRMGPGRRSLNGGPNAAYFGSLQRLMPYHLEYDFAVIRERSDTTCDSLEQDGGRMHKYWDVATTEL